MSLEQQMAQQYKAFAKQKEEQDALAEVLLPLPLLLCGCCCDGAGVKLLEHQKPRTVCQRNPGK